MESPTFGKTALVHSDEGNPYINTDLQTGVSEKLLKNGEHESPPEHTFIWRLAQFELDINNAVFPVF